MYLTADELKTTYYPKAAVMDASDVTVYIGRANSYAFGVIGGIPVYTVSLPESQLKVAVALAFEILSKGETSQIHNVSGNITEAAPSGAFARSYGKPPDPMAAVDKMLKPYSDACDNAGKAQSEKGFMWLGG